MSEPTRADEGGDAPDLEADKLASDKEARRAGWRLMRATIKPQKWWVVTGILGGLVWTSARVTVPLLAAAAIDQGILKSDEGAVLRFVIAIVVVGVVQAICTGLRRYSAFRLALRVETNLRDRLFAHLQRLHFAFHDEAQTGQLMARANSDMQQIHVVVVLLPLTAASLLTMLAVAVIILLKSPGLALLVLITLPFLNVAATRFTRRIQPVTLELQEELADLSGVVEESVAGIRVVKGFGAEKVQAARLRHEADAVLDRSMA
ncbi:MAG: ABC transporter transmembrane domain-containing protein, partial [Acidimicrobiia bacterium]